MPTLLITAELPENTAVKLADKLMEGEHFLPISAAGAFEAAPPLWRFEAWSTKPIDKADFLQTARNLTGDKKLTGFFYRQVNEQNWVKKSLDDLPPVRAGRFVIFGAHDRDKGRANEIGVEIEASLAFGTGHHPTTLGCLLELDRWCKTARITPASKPVFLDVGTGTGILALSAAKALPLCAIASDLDKNAIEVAGRHRKLAGLDRKLCLVQAQGTHHRLIKDNAPYPIVIANILAEPLVKLAPHLARVTAHNGTLILSGLLNWQARRVMAAYIAQNFKLFRRHSINEWMTLVFKKR
jgi:ribosomal protein L11 methyltransferase